MEKRTRRPGVAPDAGQQSVHQAVVMRGTDWFKSEAARNQVRVFPNDWIGTIDLLGAVHGFFLAVLLVSRRRNSVANRILAVMMIAFAFDLLSAFMYTRNLEATFPHFIGVDYLLPFLYGPVVYLYARAVSEGEALNVRGQLVHFLPFLFFLMVLIPFYFQGGAEKIELAHSPASHPWTVHLTRLNHFKMVYGLIYLVATFWLLHRHGERLKNTYSSLARINLRWLRNLLIGGAVTWGVSFLFYITWLQAADGPSPLEGYGGYVSIAVALFVYAVGYLGLRQPELFAPNAGPLVFEDHTSERKEGPSYSKSGMDDDAAEGLKARLIEAMEERRCYRKNNLTLAELALALSTTPHNLSEVINTRTGQNFYDFVNGYRVDEVKERLRDPNADHLTLLAIGLEAGFNSKSSFNAVFKKHTSMTPSEYKKTLRQT